MRIISGKFRGLPLIPPPGGQAVTRPITDRAKQSLFDALQDCFAGQRVLDCFAGTGSMGLECLSRGAGHGVFVERDRAALTALRHNIAALHAQDSSTLLALDAYALAAPHSPLADLGPFTIAFVDPPYRHTDSGPLRHKLDALLAHLAAHAMVDGGIISLRHPAHVSIDAPLLGVRIVRELRYGDMAISWLTAA